MMREVFYWPRGGETEAFQRGWDFSILASWTEFTIGWGFDRGAAEQHYWICLGPVILYGTRYTRRQAER